MFKTISQTLSLISVEITWQTLLKNILKNTFSQQFRSQIIQSKLELQGLPCRTTQSTPLALNVHLNVSRIWKMFGSFSDSSWQHIRYFIGRCPFLSKDGHAENPYSRSWHHSIDIYANGCLKIDFMGQFPDEWYIVVHLCIFTRWVELYATADATVLSTTECILQHIGCFGAPRQLRSDVW